MRFLRGGIRLFRLFGVTVFLDYSWFVFFFLVVWTFHGFYLPAQHAAATGPLLWVLAVVATVLLFFSVVFHELSHAVVSNRLGFPIRKITLFIFGGVAHMNAEPNSARTEFLVAGAGPLSSFSLWLFFLLLSSLCRATGAPSAFIVFAVVAQLNLVLALFNLVPGFPLDGGRILRSLIWWKTHSLKRATNFAAKGGEIFAYLLMIFGVLSIYSEQTPRGWITGIWYILIGVFVKNAAEQSYEHVLLEEVLAGISVGEVMGSNVLSVSREDSLDMLVEQKFMHHKFTLYPVVDQEGRVVGIVDFEDIRKVAREDRDDRAVSDVMHVIPRVKLPTAATDATQALKSMLVLGLARLPVIDEAGLLAGIVTKSDIMSMFRIRADLGDEVVV